MCGIVGFINLKGEKASSKICQRMTDMVRHRGPDGEGVYTWNNVALGHCRLAIIDLTSSGQQPMFSDDNDFVIVYNGEVYNFQEIRQDLKDIGYIFHSRTDTEVVLNAYREWGESCLDRFNGMFAFCILDKTKKTLFLARDRYGVKPLYYLMKENWFLFGSEIKSFFPHPVWRCAMDYEALLEYFTFQNYFTDRTLFKGVKIFPAGHSAYIPLKAFNDISLKKYWDFHFQEPEQAKDEREYLEELNRLIEQAVKRQMVSDVEIGSYLSGGMDTGAITAIASKHIGHLKTFTCGFDMSSAAGLEMGFDERPQACALAEYLKTDYHDVELHSGDMERCLPHVVWHIEEPRVGQSYPNYYAAKLASEKVKVVLTGTGGDELFGGYPWRYYRAVVNNNFQEYIDKYYLFWQRLVSNKTIKHMFQPIWDKVAHVWTRDIFSQVLPTEKNGFIHPEDYINYSLYFEAKTFLHGLLIVEDKLSMAHGLETRYPFLDNDLVDFAMKIPVRFKLGNLGDVVRINENEPGPKTNKYFQKTKDGKLILRKAMSRYVPDDVAERVKQGFSAPDASWFRGESVEYVKKHLGQKQARLHEFFNYEATQMLIREHVDGDKNRRLAIWSLLNFEEWLKKFMVRHRVSS